MIIQSNSCFLFPLYDDDKGDNKFFDVGKSILLSCKVTEKDENANHITWGKKQIVNGSSDVTGIKYDIKNGGDMSSLIIHKARNKDAGVYYCMHKDKKYSFNVIGRLRVKIRPSTDVCFVDGEILMLRCVGVGTKIQLNWVFDRHNSDVKYINRYSDGFASSTLVLKKVEKKHTGNYTCEGRHDDELGLNVTVSSTVHAQIRDNYAGMFNVVKWPNSCQVFLINKFNKAHNNS